MTDEKVPRALPATRAFTAADIGKVIRTRRKALGYTQVWFAELMSMSPRLVSEIERGKQTVGIQKVLSLLTALGIDLTLVVRESSREDNG